MIYTAFKTQWIVNLLAILGMCHTEHPVSSCLLSQSGSRLYCGLVFVSVCVCVCIKCEDMYLDYIENMHNREGTDRPGKVNF